MTTIGIIGAGKIGSHVAKAAIAAGYDVVIANSRGPETLAELVAELGEHARADTAAGAAAAGDFAVVTIPFLAEETLPVAELAGKVVLDTDNYYFERDGHYPAIDEGTQTVTGALQALLPGSRVAKAFNHIFSGDITTAGTPSGTPNRRALGTSSDFTDAIELVTRFQDEIGFDTVSAGPLSESWRLDRDQPAYGSAQSAEQMRTNLAAATRPGAK